MILRSKHVGAILNVLMQKNFYVCALVGVLIKWLYKMHSATIKTLNLCWKCRCTSFSGVVAMHYHFSSWLLLGMICSHVLTFGFRYRYCHSEFMHIFCLLESRWKFCIGSAVINFIIIFTCLFYWLSAVIYHLKSWTQLVMKIFKPSCFSFMNFRNQRSVI